MAKLSEKKKLRPATRGNVAVKAAAKNRAFKSRHNKQYSGKKRMSETGFGPRGREVEQPSYESILKLTPASAKKILVDAGVVVQNPRKASFSCWSC